MFDSFVNRTRYITWIHVCWEFLSCLYDCLSEISVCLCLLCAFLFVRLIMSIWCSCLQFWFEELSDLCSCVSNHTVLLVAVFLHKSPFPPYQRGFFCSDNSIRLTYKSSTVSNTVLTAVGVTVPVVSVSPSVVLQENWWAYVGTVSNHPMVGLWHLKSHDWFDRLWLTLSGFACCTSLAVNYVYCTSLPTTVYYHKLSDWFVTLELRQLLLSIYFNTVWNWINC